MATNSLIVGGKRKASHSAGKPSPRYLSNNKEAPRSTRKLWKNDNTSDKSDDEATRDNGWPEVEYDAAPVKKKVKLGEEDRHSIEAQSAKKFDKGESSRESHIKQKQLVKERKAARPLADELQRTKKLWERLRRKSHVPKEERQKLVDELFEIITGRVKDFVLKHDAVRAVQTALKYAKPEQRMMITKELRGTYAHLAESRYAKFLIGKMLVQNDPEIRDMVIPEFYGNVRKLINHPEASWILDDIYRGVATKEQKAVMLREWYGPEFALFRPTASDEAPTSELSRILEESPEKRGPIMKYLMNMINQLVQKKMNGFTMLHDAMLQCFMNIRQGTEEHTEFLQKVKDDETGDLLKNMAFTRSGSRLVCLLLAYGSAKERRQYLKLYKDTYGHMCGDQHGHRVILTAYDVIDDTVTTSKAILPEILGKSDDQHNIIFLANNLNARTTILYPFEGMSRQLFPFSHQSDLELLQEVHEIRQTTSKKHPDVRRKELIASMSPALLDAIITSARHLISTSFGCRFVTDVLLGVDGGEKRDQALRALAEAAAGDPNAAENSDELYCSEYPHPAQTAWAGHMFKKLIQGGRFDCATRTIQPVAPPLNFANILYPVIKDHVVAWATGRSSFVVVALLESEDFGQKGKIKKVLKKHVTELEKAATSPVARPTVAPGPRDADSKAAGMHAKNGGFKKDRAPPTENPGAKLLLHKL